MSSSGALAIRIVLGSIILLSLAIYDLRQRGRAATRWREYMFLLAGVAAAMLYGIINDQITSRISWEYFYYGKGLDTILGPDVPPDISRLHAAAISVGLKATWWVGLIVAAALLWANNPSPRFPRLSYRRLLCGLPIVFLVTAICGVLGGLAGRLGWLDNASEDLSGMVRDNLFRPRTFLTVYGIHLGGYAGALVGTVIAILWIRLARARESRPSDS
jgi:hypothetical protein